MPATYEPIASTTLGSAAADITFSSIPGTYTDLRLIVMGKTASSGKNLFVQMNGDTTTLYSTTQLTGDGSTARSIRTSTQSNITTYYQVGTSSEFSSSVLDIFSYANTNVFKTLLWQGGDIGEIYRAVGLYRSTSAVTSLKIYPSGATNWAASTSAALYGIKAAA